MTTIKRVALVATGVLCVLLLSMGAIPTGAATASSEAAYKAATDTDPHRSLTPSQREMRAKKIQAVSTVLSGTASAKSMTASLNAAGSTVTLNAAAATSSLPTSANVTKDQNPQKKDHWCGPATVNEALGQLGAWFTQEQLATALHTTESGTGWSVGGTSPTGFPVPDVMNSRQSKNYYIPEPVPSTPSDADVSDYKTFLMFDIATIRAPVVGDAWTTPQSDYWLVDHPRDRTIYHWFDIYGYRIGGGTTYTKYEDSVYDATSVSWYKRVTQPYSELPSHAIAHIIGGRGYVW